MSFQPSDFGRNRNRQIHNFGDYFFTQKHAGWGSQANKKNWGLRSYCWGIALNLQHHNQHRRHKRRKGSVSICRLGNLANYQIGCLMKFLILFKSSFILIVYDITLNSNQGYSYSVILKSSRLTHFPSNLFINLTFIKLPKPKLLCSNSSRLRQKPPVLDRIRKFHEFRWNTLYFYRNSFLLCL